MEASLLPKEELKLALENKTSDEFNNIKQM